MSSSLPPCLWVAPQAGHSQVISQIKTILLQVTPQTTPVNFQVIPQAAAVHLQATPQAATIHNKPRRTTFSYLGSVPKHA
jgi:hypothetical protein